MALAEETVTWLTDEDLLVRIRSGRKDMFGPLVRRYERELYGYLRRFVGDEDLAYDVFQNTFAQIFLKIRSYDPSRPARPWVYAIATNQAIDALRRKNRRPDGMTDPGTGDGEDAKPLADLSEDPNPGPAEIVETGELKDQVRYAVDRLPDSLRPVVVLVYFQGMKYQEVADLLGIPLGTVKSRLHAALGKLADCWDDASPNPA